MPRLAFVLVVMLLALGGLVTAYVVRPPASPRRTASRTPSATLPNVATIPSARSAAPLPESDATATAPVAGPADESIEALFDRATRLASRDEKGAIALFKRVVVGETESRELAARALYEIGCGLERMSRPKEARQAFEMVLDRYADLREVVELARRRLPAAVQARLGADDELRKRIQEGRVDLDVDAVPLPDVVALLRDRTRINLLIDEGDIPDAGERKVTVHLWNVTIAEALDRTCAEASAAWWIRQGCVFLCAKGCTWKPPADDPPKLPDWEKDVPAWRREQEATRAALAVTPASMCLDSASLDDVAREFQAATTKLIVVDDAVSKDAANRRVTFAFREMDPSNCLDLICRVMDLDWYVDRGTIHITTQEAAEAWRKAHE